MNEPISRITRNSMVWTHHLFVTMTSIGMTTTTTKMVRSMLVTIKATSSIEPLADVAACPHQFQLHLLPYMVGNLITIKLFHFPKATERTM